MSGLGDRRGPRGGGGVIAEAIRAARLRGNLTQVELAERIGVTARTVSGWERGAPVSRNLLPKVEEVLGVANSAPLRLATEARIVAAVALHPPCHDPDPAKWAHDWDCLYGHSLEDGRIEPDEPPRCTHCTYDARVVEWPCPTVQALLGA